MGWRFVLSLVFAVIVALFAIQNAEAVPINFIAWKVSVSQALIILVSAVVGAVIVMLLSLIKQIRMGSNIRSEKKTVSSLQTENIELRNKLDQSNERISSLVRAAAQKSAPAGDASLEDEETPQGGPNNPPPPVL